MVYNFWITLVSLGTVSMVSAWELWWSVEGTKFGFDEMFRWNLKREKNLDGNSEQKKRLIEFLRYNGMAKIELADHNARTDFHPKHLERRVIIPYMTHQIWLTTGKPDSKPMDEASVWDMVAKMGEEVAEDIDWKHIFWTNDKKSIKLNATACDGRCEIRTLDLIPGYQEIEGLVEQMIKADILNVDLLKPLILYHFGGLYLNINFHYEQSFKFLHRVMDSYTGFEGMNWPGLSPGIIAARPKHQAMWDWLNFVLQYYGYREDDFGTLSIMPMPTFKEDLYATSGPRALSFAIWNNLNKWGNNDAIFKTSMIALDTTHGSYRQQRKTGQIIDITPKEETLKIGGKFHEFKRFGYTRFERDFGFRTKSGEWNVNKDLMWKLPDGHEEVQLWLIDLTDRQDILSPNYVTQPELKKFRAKYKSRQFCQKIIFDKWLANYFKTYDGRYIDRLLELEERKKANKTQDATPIHTEL